MLFKRWRKFGVDIFVYLFVSLLHSFGIRSTITIPPLRFLFTTNTLLSLQYWTEIKRKEIVFLCKCIWNAWIILLVLSGFIHVLFIIYLWKPKARPTFSDEIKFIELEKHLRYQISSVCNTHCVSSIFSVNKLNNKKLVHTDVVDFEENSFSFVIQKYYSISSSFSGWGTPALCITLSINDLIIGCRNRHKNITQGTYNKFGVNWGNHLDMNAIPSGQHQQLTKMFEQKLKPNINKPVVYVHQITKGSDLDIAFIELNPSMSGSRMTEKRSRSRSH